MHTKSMSECFEITPNVYDPIVRTLPGKIKTMNDNYVSADKNDVNIASQQITCCTYTHSQHLCRGGRWT